MDAKYKLVEATVRAGDLEKQVPSIRLASLIHKLALSHWIYVSRQVDSLKKELETQTKRKAVLESRANLAEKKIQDLNHKLENVSIIYLFKMVMEAKIMVSKPFNLLYHLFIFLQRSC